MLTLAQAAAMTGMNRSSILRAIKRGALTGTKDHNDVWHVDGAELARVFPVTPPNTQPTREDTHPDALAAERLALAEERITGLKERLAEMQERLTEMRHERDRARAGEDAWKAQCEAVTRQLALPSPKHAQGVQQPEQARTAVPTIGPKPAEPSRLRRAWRW